MFDIVVHYPKTPEKIADLQKRVADIHAQAVARRIEKLSCPKEQKLKLYDDIIEAHRELR